jgi:PAS domain S-box-containing protein
MAENMSDVISLMDMNFRFTYISPSIIRLSGYTVEEAQMLSVEDIMTPDSLSEVLKIIEEEMMAEVSKNDDPDRSRIIEYKQYRKDKSIAWVESNCRFLRDGGGKTQGNSYHKQRHHRT